jgi:hypothetical protein
VLRPRGGRQEEKRGRGEREAQLSSIPTSSVNIRTVANNLPTKYQLSSEGSEKKKRDEEVKDMKKVKKTCIDGSVNLSATFTMGNFL